MDIRNIITFLRVADRKNFTKAGEELHYAQSTVTNQIKQLEKELGYPLLDRMGKKVTLTTLGREFLPLAKQIVKLQQEALSLNKASQEMHGMLCLGITESLLLDTMVTVLPRYGRLYPHVDIKFMTSSRSELMTWLQQNRLDLVYLTGPEYQDPELLCCYKRRERLIFVTSAQHPLVGKRRVPLQEILVYPYLDTDRSGYCYTRFKELASRHGLSLRQSATIDNTQAIAEILLGNTAFSYLPEYSVRKEIACGHLAELDAAFEPQYYYSQILYHKDKWVPPFMTGLIELIRDFRPDDGPQ